MDKSEVAHFEWAKIGWSPEISAGCGMEELVKG